jgi:transcription elongation GreA/GreB family factor
LNIGAGYDLQWDGRLVKCISTQSAIGQALMGKTIGDFIGAGPVGKEKEYEIIDLIE